MSPVFVKEFSIVAGIIPRVKRSNFPSLYNSLIDLQIPYPYLC